MSQQQTLVGNAEVRQSLGNQTVLHESLVRAGYLMPDLRDRIINSKFLLGVSTGHIWLPKSHKKSLQECVKVPDSDYLREECLKALRRMQSNREAVKRLITCLQKATPRKTFMVKLLSQLEPNHKIFDLNFTPSIKRESIAPVSAQELKISSSIVQFAQNAPRKKGAKGLRIPITKQERVEAELKKLERKISIAKERQAAMKASLVKESSKVGLVRNMFNSPQTHLLNSGSQQQNLSESAPRQIEPSAIEEEKDNELCRSMDNLSVQDVNDQNQDPATTQILTNLSNSPPRDNQLMHSQSDSGIILTDSPLKMIVTDQAQLAGFKRTNAEFQRDSPDQSDSISQAALIQTKVASSASSIHNNTRKQTHKRMKS